MIYRLGSKGDGVSEIQLALKLAGYDVKMDGDYGAKTREAVVAFQRSRGIGADGIVGPKTLALLKEVLAMGTKNTDPTPGPSPTKGGESGAVVITNGYIWQHVTRCANRAIRYIAVHYTAGTTSRRGQAMQVRQVFLQRSASADFVVDDGTIVQINPDLRNYYCWSVGDKKNIYSEGGRLYGIATNRNTVSIEICSTLAKGVSSVPNHEGWSLTNEAVENTIKLVRHLMNLYNIPKTNVIRHYDISGKLCPGVPGWNNGPLYSTNGNCLSGRKSDSRKWEKFLAAL